MDFSNSKNHLLQNAYECGFSHLGKNKFGELPSQALKKGHNDLIIKKAPEGAFFIIKS